MRRYAIGIDLGTTNSVLAWQDLEIDAAPIEVATIPQLLAAGTVGSLSTLASFLYLASDHEAGHGSLDLPWATARDWAAGEYARRQSADVPTRTVAAAKSWLCHSQVDRHQPILPWEAPEEVRKISPVEATRRCVEHIVAAWNHARPDAPLAEQVVVLAVPASFDASARELTREAALAAGLPADFTLLEEPQAAVYAWLGGTGDAWRERLARDDVLLVCDIGGGTTDFTLVRVDEEDGELVLHRIAVGNHILVGGDNMDVALAHHASTLLAEQGARVDAWQSVSLWHACRAAKEQLFAADGPETQTISVAGRGSRLIGGSISAELHREETAGLLLDGFFPRCGIDATPARGRASGFQELGLPFEADPAVTRHLARFLRSQSNGAKTVTPTHLLFNGGCLKAERLRSRLLEVVRSWFGGETPRLLEGNEDLDFAVARGAAHFGHARERGGVRIRGGTARSYYVGIESSGLAVPGLPRPLRALCVVPFDMEEGSAVEVPGPEIGLVVGEPAHFRFFGSAVRRHDRPGDVVDRWGEDELVETDSLEATLAVDGDGVEGHVPVRFHARITELGVLELWCAGTTSDCRWKLEFSVREDAS